MTVGAGVAGGRLSAEAHLVALEQEDVQEVLRHERGVLFAHEGRQGLLRRAWEDAAMTSVTRVNSTKGYAGTPRLAPQLGSASASKAGGTSLAATSSR